MVSLFFGGGGGHINQNRFEHIMFGMLPKIDYIDMECRNHVIGLQAVDPLLPLPLSV